MGRKNVWSWSEVIKIRLRPILIRKVLFQDYYDNDRRAHSPGASLQTARTIFATYGSVAIPQCTINV